MKNKNKTKILVLLSSMLAQLKESQQQDVYGRVV